MGDFLIAGEPTALALPTFLTYTTSRRPFFSRAFYSHGSADKVYISSTWTRCAGREFLASPPRADGVRRLGTHDFLSAMPLRDYY